MTTRVAIPATDLGLDGRDDATGHARQPTYAGTGTPLSTRWQSQVTAVRSPGTEPWEPSGEALERARRGGATLRRDADGYELTFTVSAPDLALATRAAMSAWARLYERCTLPDWQLSAVTVTNDDATRYPAAPAQRRPRRSQRPPLNRQPGLAVEPAGRLTTPVAGASPRPRLADESEPSPIRAAASASH